MAWATRTEMVIFIVAIAFCPEYPGFNKILHHRTQPKIGSHVLQGLNGDFGLYSDNVVNYRHCDLVEKAAVATSGCKKNNNSGISKPRVTGTK